ncbi:hypothetical protein [Spiroplasma endosymbiont of Aspidapion aeneum]|uniref:hypothetical protein n=1 Tax=Spiroplasma endosymbiont of Aspidapion aeneum TaxID=3066276 RepID=UPI00313F34FA
MAKKYTKETDFKLLSSRLKRRIKDLLENKITVQTIAILSNELISFSPEMKLEIIEYVTFLSEKFGLENPNSGIYAARAMERKGEEKTNQFYITQMKKILLDDQKKSKEGFFRESNYISSNALYVEDVENDISNKTVELVNTYGNEEINSRYILEADDEKQLYQANFKKSKEDVVKQETGIEEMLRKKEELERREMEMLRKQLAEQRLHDEQEMIKAQDAKKNSKK